MALMNGVQRIGAQEITGAFRTVVITVAEAEAVCAVLEQHAERVTTLWVNFHTLPRTNPLES